MTELPPGRMPAIGMSQLVAAIHRRRTRRREAAGELSHALAKLRDRVEQHIERIASVRAAIEAQGGDLAHLQVYDNAMARLRAELHNAERSLAEAFRQAL